MLDFRRASSLAMVAAAVALLVAAPLATNPDGSMGDNPVAWLAGGQAAYGQDPPAVVNVTAADGTYGLGAVVPITVAFDKTVHVTGSGIKVGVPQGHTIKSWLDDARPSLDYAEYDDYSEMLNDLKSGEIDALINFLKVVEYQKVEHNITGLPLHDNGTSGADAMLSFSYNKNNATLGSVLDKAVADMSDAERERIFRDAELAPSSEMGLTADETEYLANLTEPLRVAYDPGWKPLEYLEDGELKGLPAAYMSRLGEALDVKFVPAANVTSWTNALEQIRDGTADVVFNANDTAERRAAYDMRFTAAHTTIPWVMVTNGTNSDVRADNLDNINIGIIEDYSIEAWLNDTARNYTYAEYDTHADAFAALGAGTIDTLIEVWQVAEYQAPDEVNATNAGPVGHDLDLSIGYHMNNAMLGSILDKAVAYIPADERDSILRDTPLSPSSELGLTAAETAYLVNKTLNVAYAPDWAPYEYYEDGELKGLPVAYMNRLSEMLDVEFSVVPNIATWLDALSTIKSGAADVMFGVVDTDAHRNDYDMAFTSTHTTFPWTIITSNDTSIVTEELIAAPFLRMETGDTDRKASYHSGDGSSSITFNYLVQHGDASDDLDYTGDDALVVEGNAKIEDSSSAPASAMLVLPQPGENGSLGETSDLIVNAAIDTRIVDVTSPDGDGTYTTGDAINVTVSFNEAVYTEPEAKDITVGIGQDYAIESWLNTERPGLKYLEYTPHTAMFNALVDGEIDAIIEAWDVAKFQADRSGIDGLNLFNEGESGDVLALSLGYNMDNAELGSILDKAVGNLSDAEKQRMFRDAPPSPSSELGLTADETEYLANLTEPLRVAYAPGWEPLEYLEDGELKGLPAAYMSRLGEALDVKFVPAANVTSWTNALEQIRDGTADVVFNANDTVERRTTYNMSFTDAHTTIPWVMVTNGTNSDVRADNLDNINIGIIEDYSIEAWLNDTARNYTYAEYDTHADAFAALGAGTIDTLIEVWQVAEYQAPDEVNATNAGPVGHDLDLSIGYHMNNAMLGSIMDKAVAYIPADERDSILRDTPLSPVIDLTAEEKTYLAGLTGPLNVAYAPDWAPYEYYENDTLKGLPVAYTNRLSEMLDVKFATAPGITTWTSSLDAIKTGAADVLFNVEDTEERRSSYNMGFTVAHTDVPWDVITNGATSSVTAADLESANDLPTVWMETGAIDRPAWYAAGNGTETFQFRYVVQAGDATPDLNYNGTDALVYGDTTIRDAASDVAIPPGILVLPEAGSGNALSDNKDITINTAPTPDTSIAVTSVTSSNADGTYTAGDAINVAVSFNEAVSIMPEPEDITVGIGQDYAIESWLNAERPGLMYMEYTRHTDMFNALVAGEIDAIIEAWDVAKYQADRSGIAGLDLKNNNGSGDVLALSLGYNMDNGTLGSILNKAVGNLSDAEKQRMFRDAPPSPAAELGLTAGEIAYLEGLEGPLRVAYDPEWKPLEYLEDGELKGLPAAYTSRLGEALDVEFAPANITSWSNALEQVGNGTADVMFSVNDTAERRTTHEMAFTAAHTTIPWVMVTDGENATVNADNLGNIAIGIITDYSVEAWLMAEGHDYTEYDTHADAFAALGAGTIDTLIEVWQVAVFQAPDEVNATNAGPVGHDLDLSIGYHMNNGTLGSILDKAVAYIPADERNSILRDTPLSPVIDLTAAETAYLAGLTGPLNVAYAPDWAPYEYYENDTLKGLPVAYTNRLSEMLDVEFATASDITNWVNSLNAIAGGTADVLFNVEDTAERRSTYNMGFTVAHTDVPWDVITNGDDQPVTASDLESAGGLPTVWMETGAIDRPAWYTGGSGTETFQFRYMVQAGDATPDLNYNGTGALVPNGVTFRVTETMVAIPQGSLVLPEAGSGNALSDNKDIVIYTTSAAVTSVTSSNADGTYTAGDAINVAVSFNEAVSIMPEPEDITVGIGQDYAIESWLNAERPGLMYMEYTRHTDMFNALVAGEIDAIIEAWDVAKYQADRSGIAGLDLKNNNGSGDVLALSLGYNMDNGTLGSILNKAVGNLSDAEKQRMFRDAPPSPAAELGLTAGEIAYLEGLEGPLRVAYDPEWKPLEYLEDGELKGLPAAYTSRLGEALDVEFAPANITSWSNALEQVGNGTADVMFSVNDTAERRTTHEMAFTAAHTTIPWVMVTDGENATVNADNLGNIAIGIITDYSVEAWLMAEGHDYTEYDTHADAFAALGAGTIDTLIEVWQVAVFQAPDEVNATNAGPVGHDLDLSIGYHMNNGTLGSILDKAVAYIPADERNSILRDTPLSPVIDLTAAETAYLAGLTGPLNVAYAPDWAPYEYYENDTLKGLPVAYTNRLSEMLDVEFATASDITNWVNSLNAIAGGTADVLFNVEDTAERRSTYNMGFTVAHTDVPWDVITNGDDQPVTASDLESAGGLPTVWMETGAIDRPAWYTGGSGTETFQFRYMVQAGDATPDLNYNGTGALVYGDAAIRDASSGAIPQGSLVLPGAGSGNALSDNKDIVIDTALAPATITAVTSVTSLNADGSYTTGDAINVAVSFNEAVSIMPEPEDITVGIGQDYAIESWLNTERPSLMYLEYTRHTEMFNALVAEDIDAIIEAWAVAKYQADRSGIAGLDLFNEGESGAVLALSLGYNMDNAELGTILNKAVGDMSDAEKQRMFRDAPPSPSSELNLTDAEMQYLAGLTGPLRVAYDPGWKPLEYLEDGELKGLPAAYMSRLGEALDVKFAPANIASWTDALEQVGNGTADVMFSVNDTADRRAAYDMRFTAAHTTMPWVMVTNGTNDDVRADNLGNIAIGIITDYAIEDWLVAEGHAYTEYDTHADAFAALGAGTIDTLIEVWQVAEYQAPNELNVNNAGSVGHNLDLSIGYHMANGTLGSILDKAVAYIPADERNSILRDTPLSPVIDLTAAETAYLAGLTGPLNVAYAPDWAPYEYYEDGELKGLPVAYTNRLSEMLDVEFATAPGITNWVDSLNAIAGGTADVLFNVEDTAERRSLYNMGFTDAHTDVPWDVITNGATSSVTPTALESTNDLPTLLMETGAIDRPAGYAGGSGTNTFQFRYVVQAGDETPDLNYKGTGALAPNGVTFHAVSTMAAIPPSGLVLPEAGSGNALSDNKNIRIATSLDDPSTAVAQASPGGTVNIRPGEYANVVLTIDKPLTLSATRGLATFTGDSRLVISGGSAAGTVTVSGLTFDTGCGTEAPIKVAPANAGVRRPVVIENNMIANTCAGAIDLVSDGSATLGIVTIRNNVIEGSSTGAAIEGVHSLSDSAITSNYILARDSAGEGITLSGTDDVIISDNHIAGTADGITLMRGSDNAIIAGNTLINISNAIQVWADSSRVVATLNTISDGTTAFAVRTGQNAEDIGNAIRFNHNIVLDYGSNTDSLIVNDATGTLNASSNYYPVGAPAAVTSGSGVEYLPIAAGRGPVEVGGLLALTDLPYFDGRNNVEAVKLAFDRFNEAQVGTSGISLALNLADLDLDAPLEDLKAMHMGLEDSAYRPVLQHEIDWMIGLYNSSGATAAFEAINALNSKQEHYPFAINMDGLVQANGYNSSRQGVMSAIAANATAFAALRDDLAAAGNEPVWFDYSITNPVTGETQAKRSLLAMHDRHIFGAGYYTGDGPSYYVGPSTSGAITAVKPYADANDLILVSPSSLAPSLAMADDGIFRLAPSDNNRAPTIASVLVNSSIKGVVPVVQDDAYGNELVRLIKSEYTVSSNGEFGETISFASGNTEWSSQLVAMNAAIDTLSSNVANRSQLAVLYIGFDPSYVSLAEAANSYLALRTVPWFTSDVASSQAVLESQTALDFSRMTNLSALTFHVESNSITEAVDSAISTPPGPATATTAPPLAYAYSAYDSVFVLGQTLLAGADGPVGVRDGFADAAAAYSGALGNLTLDAAGDLATPNTYGIWSVSPTATEWVRPSAVIEGERTMCGISLSSPTLDFGSVRAGQMSGTATQTLMNTGTVPVGSITMTATAWSISATGGTMPSYLTETKSESATGFAPLSQGSVAAPSLSQSGSASVDFRINLQGQTASSASPISQDVSYSVTCGS